MGRGKDLDSYIEELTRNISEDRATVKLFLTDLIADSKKPDLTHQEVGFIAAKYIETLQRSNEQLVKIATLVQKDTKASSELTLEDKQELFDLIIEQES